MIWLRQQCFSRQISVLIFGLLTLLQHSLSSLNMDNIIKEAENMSKCSFSVQEGIWYAMSIQLLFIIINIRINCL